MTFSNGVDAHLVYAVEATPFTRSAPTIAVPLLSESMADTGSQPIRREGIIKGRRTSHGSDRAKSDVGGQVTVPLTAESIGGLLGCLVGTVGTRTGSTGAYVFPLTPGPLRPWSMQVGWEDNAGFAYWKDYVGCLANGGTLNVQANQHPTLQLDVRARSESKSDDDTEVYAEVAPSYATLTYFEFSDFVMSFDSGDDECFDTIALNWANNLYQSPAICPTAPRATVYEDSGNQMVSGTIGQDFVDWTKYAKFAAGTEATIQITGTAGTRILDIALNVILLGETPAVPGRERIKQGLPFEIQSGTSDADACTVTLTTPDDDIDGA